MELSKKQRKSNSKQNKLRLTITLAVFLLVVGVVIGTTLAYFSGKDAVTNIIHGREVSIQLYELNWEAEGKAAAQKTHPGQTIKKDPYVLNTSLNEDVYVRFKITIKKDGVEQKITDYAPYIFSAEAAAKYGNTASSREDLHDKSGSTLMAVTGEVIISQNPYFKYKDGYFYYISNGTDFGNRIGPNDVTKRLFDEIRIPILKAEYTTLFDKDFEIIIEAEAVPYSYVGEEKERDSNGNHKLSDIINAF